jgi:hypothetical protein
VITKAVQARAHSRTFAIGIDYITDHTHQRAVAAAGHTFDGSVAYASATEKAEWVHLRRVASVETAAIEMEAVAALSVRCRDPVYHLIIAYAKHERPTREQVVSDAERLLKAIGMEKHQYVLAAHKDTDDFHAHVIANRVGPDGRANDLWHERIIRERVCAEIAAERSWDIVVGRHNRDIVQRIEHLHDPPREPERRLSDGAYRRLHERGELPWQDIARPYILEAVDRARDWSDLHQRLGAHGVVAKLVRRGEQVQGLAFAEGFSRTAPGCAASRVDARCALASLERRFGPFVPSRKPVERSEPWSDSVRPTILAAVDEATSWSDLTQRLQQHGVAIKLVVRGGRVQGFAFAESSHPDAAGCGASRIDPRCKKAALEKRFGPFPRDDRHAPGHDANERNSDGSPYGRGNVRDRAEHDTRSDPSWALRNAEHIVDHARMRSAYATYRERFFSKNDRALGTRRDAAWERERAQRQLETQRRRDARRLLRAVARFGTRGVLAHHLAYWSIDAVMARRRAHEYNTSRLRWEATKIALATERGLARKEKPMDYRSFVTEQARAGDVGAQRVLDVLVPARRPVRVEPQRESRPVGLHEVRLRLDVIRAEEEAGYECARGNRERLQRVAHPAKLDDVLSAERKWIEKQAADTTQTTEAEHARLTRIADQKRSWNPLTRVAAAREEQSLHATQRSRFEAAVTESMRNFEANDVPQISRRVATDERRYRQWVTTSLALEGQMREARELLRNRIPRIEQRISVLERRGTSHVELHGDMTRVGLRELAVAVDQQYSALSETLRREAERSILREQRDRDWSRDMSMGGL